MAPKARADNLARSANAVPQRSRKKKAPPERGETDRHSCVYANARRRRRIPPAINSTPRAEIAKLVRFDRPRPLRPATVKFRRHSGVVSAALPAWSPGMKYTADHRDGSGHKAFEAPRIRCGRRRLGVKAWNALPRPAADTPCPYVVARIVPTWQKLAIFAPKGVQLSRQGSSPGEPVAPCRPSTSGRRDG